MAVTGAWWPDMRPQLRTRVLRGIVYSAVVVATLACAGYGAMCIDDFALTTLGIDRYQAAIFSGNANGIARATRITLCSDTNVVADHWIDDQYLSIDGIWACVTDEANLLLVVSPEHVRWTLSADAAACHGADCPAKWVGRNTDEPIVRLRDDPCSASEVPLRSRREISVGFWRKVTLLFSSPCDLVGTRSSRP